MKLIVESFSNAFFLKLQYKTERDGVVETRVEQKITIQSDGDPIDHDKALAEAIQVRKPRTNCFHSQITNEIIKFLPKKQEATAMNPDMTVEKIEIQQQTQ